MDPTHGVCPLTSPSGVARLRVLLCRLLLRWWLAVVGCLPAGLRFGLCVTYFPVWLSAHLRVCGDRSRQEAIQSRLLLTERSSGAVKAALRVSLELFCVLLNCGPQDSGSGRIFVFGFGFISTTDGLNGLLWSSSASVLDHVASSPGLPSKPSFASVLSGIGVGEGPSTAETVMAVVTPPPCERRLSRHRPSGR